eukprot:CAMPEP_0170490486 /NCGR_PEP_ID=MMETSP0208-20121228/8665_1 /TAXON_ID=197538 /ORGANISM="Strombidium inclinatum, Strain S3" /LENGTH=69 /DNA_ID=CAMNT_0010765871 /DNA_START=453 /DNA_END=662 /DNA_ORIENTATION=+
MIELVDALVADVAMPGVSSINSFAVRTQALRVALLDELAEMKVLVFVDLTGIAQGSQQEEDVHEYELTV